MAARWYVLHVYSGFESKVAQSIREKVEQFEMADSIEEVLVPIEEVVEMRRGSKKSAERKFFPGYVLVKMNMSDETWHLVKDTPKVTGFLGAQGKPSPISEAEAQHATPGTLTHAGWVKKHSKTRSGVTSVWYETLVASSSITGDAEATDGLG